MIKAIFFDIDDTLYDSTELANRARMNAVLAMIDAGLEEKNPRKVFSRLKKIVKKYGSNYQYHFSRLLEEFDMSENPAIIAAGVAAYHDTKLSYIKPFPDTVPVLLYLRDKGYKLGVISEGVAVKQWEKLIRLGLQHFFHEVILSESAEADKSTKRLYEVALKAMDCKPWEAVMVGDKLDKDIKKAREVGLRTVWIKHRKYGMRWLKGKPDFVIDSLIELPKVIAKIK